MTVRAHFTPEAWIRDQAIEVDPEGEQEWDATSYAAEHAEYLDRLVAREEEHRKRWPSVDTGDFEVCDNDDVFQDDPAAPEWVREWHGPFTINLTIQEA